MERALKLLRSDWSIILLASVLLFVFWGGSVFTAQSLHHGGRLIVSYVFIPVAVVFALWRRNAWSWGAWGSYSLGISLIKMVVTMIVYLWVQPSGQRVQSKPIGPAESTPALATRYTGATLTTSGRLTGMLIDAGAVSDARITAPASRVVAIQNIRFGRTLQSVAVPVKITGGRIEPAVLAVTVGDTLIVANRDSDFHTFSLVGADGQLFQLPLPAQRLATRRIGREGVFTSRCVRGHGRERLALIAFEHPYHTVAGADGTFALDSIPPGEYHLGMWECDSTGSWLSDDPAETVTATVRAGEDNRIDWNLIGTAAGSGE